MVLFRVTDPSTGREITTSDPKTAETYGNAQLRRWENAAVTIRTNPATGKSVRTARYAAPDSGAVARNAQGQVIAAGYAHPATKEVNLDLNRVPTVEQQLKETRLYMNPLAGPPSLVKGSPPQGPAGAFATIGATMLRAGQGFANAFKSGGIGGIIDWTRNNPVQAGAMIFPVAGAAAIATLAVNNVGKGGQNMPYGIEAPGGPLLGGLLGKKGLAGDTVLGSSHGYLLLQDDVNGRIIMVKKAKHRRTKCGRGSGGFNMNKIMQIMMMKAMLKG